MLKVIKPLAGLTAKLANRKIGICLTLAADIFSWLPGLCGEAKIRALN